MKRLFLVIIIAALAMPQAGQAGWWRTYGGQTGNCVQITSDGNYVFSGSNSLNLVLYKVDTLGKIIWSHTYGRSDTWLWRWIEETSDGGFIIAPRTPSLLKINSQGDTMWNKDYGIESHCVQQTKDGGYIFTGDFAELRLVKTNPEGDTIWTRKFSEPGNDNNVGYFIQITEDGGYIITGLTEYFDGYNAWDKLWLVKTDSLGNKKWSKIYGEDYSNSIGYCVRQTNDGGYIISGVSPKGLWLLKTNSDGDTIWTKTYSFPSGGGAGFSVKVAQDGGYIVTGVTETSTAVSSNSGSAKLWLLKTDSFGDTLWTRFYNANNWAVGRCVQQTNDLGYVVLGYSSSGIYLLKTDSLGFLAVSEQPAVVTNIHWEIPVPLGPKVLLRYSNQPCDFRAVVFDVIGRKVDEINASNPSGTIVWGSNHPSGVYFICVDEKNNTRAERVILIH